MRRQQQMRAFLALVVVCTLSSSAFGQTRQQVPATRFWNLTPFTLSEFNLAPTGTTNWGPNQCKNDRDGTVSPNERLRITDTAPGIYDQPLDKPHDPLQIPAPASQLRRIGAFDGCAGNESISGAGNAWIWKCTDLEMHGQSRLPSRSVEFGPSQERPMTPDRLPPSASGTIIRPETSVCHRSRSKGDVT